ncbi:MAG: large subunit ribosomal protein L2 [Verrucomicrobiales bacterium]|jgi:large subunit ribosomal protein L2
MPLKKHRPFTPSSRYKYLPDFSEITKDKPEKNLTRPLKKSGGRNNRGRITCRHRGGGHKRKYRIIDFKRRRYGDVATVIAIEYDPNRTSRIALIEYGDGERAYIIAPVKLGVGDKIESGEDAAPNVGNSLPLGKIPAATAIHCLELTPGRGAQLVRSAGQSAVLAAVDGDYALIRLPSGETRRINSRCYATIGIVGNSEHMNECSAKAGRTRWKGIRPTVRGMCMNPVDHPNGGGEGKSKSGGGRQHLKSPWGHVKGQKTRVKHKPSDKWIVQRRNAKKK